MAPCAVFDEVDIFITRRVAGRQMRLRPSRKTNRLVGYIVAVISKKCGILIHAICVLSDHYHIVFHDPFGRSVDFKRECHQFVAQALNDSYGDKGSVWASEQTSTIRPVTPADTLDRIYYTMANPVKHGLVKFGKSWPGLRRRWPQRPVVFKRPNLSWFQDGEAWPESIALEFHRPLGFEEMSDNELALLIHEGIEKAEEHYRKERGNKPFLGRAKVLETDRYARATSPEKKRRRHKTVVCADPDLLEEAEEKERLFRAQHADRLKRWRAGDRSVVFPHGTYKMRVLHKVNVADPPPT